ncbi:hypothetical protein [Sphaerothrix gracilis]|uniref:hypothetical protein n=1 Tax=Sphaerothrix gracilis TaxID=3151835 RepID=UPI0031FC8EF6
MILRGFGAIAVVAAIGAVSIPLNAQGQMVSPASLSELDAPLCYLETNEGGLVDLSEFCGSETDSSADTVINAAPTPVRAVSNSAQPGSQSGRAALSPSSRSNDDSPCFIFDAQGRRCG